MIHHPRFLHRIFAFFTGYFWMDCPRCGRPFAGYESGGSQYYGGWGEITCWRCPGDEIMPGAYERDAAYYNARGGGQLPSAR